MICRIANPMYQVFILRMNVLRQVNLSKANFNSCETPSTVTLKVGTLVSTQ